MGDKIRLTECEQLILRCVELLQIALIERPHGSGRVEHRHGHKTFRQRPNLLGGTIVPE